MKGCIVLAAGMLTQAAELICERCHFAFCANNAIDLDFLL